MLKLSRILSGVLVGGGFVPRQAVCQHPPVMNYSGVTRALHSRDERGSAWDR